LKRQGKETSLVRTILDYLAYRKVWAYRQNTGGLRDTTGRLVRFGVVGHPDIVARITPRDGAGGSGRVIWIEAKSSTGRQTPAQKEWQEKAERHGDVYILARCLEDVSCLFERPTRQKQGAGGDRDAT